MLSGNNIKILFFVVVYMDASALIQTYFHRFRVCFTSDLKLRIGIHTTHVDVCLLCCLIDTVNETFQNDIKKTFGNIFSIHNGSCYVSSAPVKNAERCKIKCNTDYASKKWPKAAQIVCTF